MVFRFAKQQRLEALEERLREQPCKRHFGVYPSGARKARRLTWSGPDSLPFLNGTPQVLKAGPVTVTAWAEWVGSYPLPHPLGDTPARALLELGQELPDSLRKVAVERVLVASRFCVWLGSKRRFESSRPPKSRYLSLGDSSAAEARFQAGVVSNDPSTCVSRSVAVGSTAPTAAVVHAPR
jgi:hypothetical protein